MNYFELYDLPVLFEIDLSYIKKKYFILSRQYHPDFFANASKEKQAEALEKSSMINSAYKIFQSRDETIRYVLELHHLVEEEEKYKLDPEFLMDVMEINEQLMDIAPPVDEDVINEIRLRAYELLNQMEEAVKEILFNYHEDKTPGNELLLIKDFYYKRKYLQRILDKIGQLRNIATL
jgi:molecular chaperone HscB